MLSPHDTFSHDTIPFRDITPAAENFHEVMLMLYRIPDELLLVDDTKRQ